MKDPIYKPSGRAGEYGDLALNIYTGCNHGCVYCYAPRVLRKTPEAFAEVQPRAGIVEAVRRQLAKGDFSGQVIHLCFTCDPYPAEIDTTPTREVIEAIKGSGNHVQILTKGGFRAERDLDLLGPDDWFGVTFTNNTYFGPHEREPKAAPSAERLATLERAKRNGIQTWVSCEPVYDPESIYSLIGAADYIDLFKIGKLNYAPSSIDWGHFGRECERLCRKHRRDYYIKADLRAEMEGQK